MNRDSRIRDGLRLHRGILVDPGLCAAQGCLLSDALGIEADRVAERWTSFAWFNAAGRCVGNVDATCLSLISDGASRPVTAIRSVVVDPDFRGRGLFRDLMEAALDWCDEHSAPLTLIYTETPSLYARFGFRVIRQHAVLGGAHELKVLSVPRLITHARPVRRLDPLDPDDRRIVRTLVERRAPLSLQCALNVSCDTIMNNVAKDPDIVLAFAPSLDSLIVYEGDTHDLTLVDLISTRVPELGAVLLALGMRPKHLKVMFPPDQIGWQGAIVSDDTGLMARGALPPSMTRPFMFPPTVEF